MNSINMSDVWKITPSLKHKVEQCINAASKKENKWTQRFKRKKMGPEESKLTTEEAIHKQLEVTSTAAETDKCFQEIKEKGACDSRQNLLESEINYETFFEEIESDPISKFEEIVTRCLCNRNILKVLEDKISEKACIKLFNHFFTVEMDEQFTTYFYEDFVTVFFEKQSSRHCLELLIKVKTKHHLEFKKFIQTIFTSSKYSSDLLKDLVCLLDSQGKTEFLHVTAINIPFEIFVKHLQTLHIAYKDCEKNDSVQSIILNHIMKHADDLNGDRNFGRLILTFLLSHKALNLKINNSNFESILENHKSPFKRPCCNIYKEIQCK